MTQLIDCKSYTNVIKLLRQFFDARGFVECHTQNRLSILAACEDPTTVATYQYAGQVWPLPQTGQMWLEYELLNNPSYKGVYCISTSYRQEANPVAGRHDLIFPMFEFEFPGNLDDLIKLEQELCTYLGFKQKGIEYLHGKSDKWPVVEYEEISKKYNASILEAEQEEQLYKDYGEVVLLKNFPERTSPFWNMKRGEDGISHKVDVIIKGIETIGSAERSTDEEYMRDSFHTISDGEYANLLYSLFSKERVLKELDEFLEFKFFPRVGAGVGLTRLINAVETVEII